MLRVCQSAQNTLRLPPRDASTFSLGLDAVVTTLSNRVPLLLLGVATGIISVDSQRATKRFAMSLVLGSWSYSAGTLDNSAKRSHPKMPA